MAPAFNVHVSRCQAKTTEDMLPVPKFTLPPNQVLWSVETLYQRICNGTIDLDVPYQRGIVWDKRKQIKLIWSLYNNMPIAPVLFTMKNNNQYSCIDGKQRLTAVFEFLSGKLRPNTDNIVINDRTCEQLRSIILQRYMMVMVYQDNFDEEICREIFNVVQNSVPLTDGEMIHAAEGGDAGRIKKIYENIKALAAPYGNKRYAGYELVRRELNSYYGLKIKSKENASKSNTISDSSVEEFSKIISAAMCINAGCLGEEKSPRVVVLRFILSKMRDNVQHMYTKDFATALTSMITATAKESPTAFATHSSAKALVFTYTPEATPAPK